MASIEFEHVAKSFGDVAVVKGLDLVIPDGQFTVLVGPSGCGKTTTLRMLAGLESVTGGSIKIGDRDVTELEPKERDVAMVFQNYALYAHLSVADNIAFPLLARGAKRADVQDAIMRAATALNLEALLDRKPKQLSGGQQQRVAIGRAIVRDPHVFLFDEPLSNLDAKLREEMRTEILRLQRRLGTTTVYVTHDQEEAMTLSDVMVVMKDGEISQMGAPTAVYAEPANVFVAGFVGSPRMNLVAGQAGGGTFTASTGWTVSVPARLSGAITLGVRPEDMRVAAAPGAGNARVEIVELLGPRAIVTLRASGQSLTAVVEASDMAGVSEGADVTVTVAPERVHAFDAATGLRI